MVLNIGERNERVKYDRNKICSWHKIINGCFLTEVPSSYTYICLFVLLLILCRRSILLSATFVVSRNKRIIGLVMLLILLPMNYCWKCVCNIVGGISYNELFSIFTYFTWNYVMSILWDAININNLELRINIVYEYNDSFISIKFEN